MEFKRNINYLEILSKYVTDPKLSNEIQCNIDFVEQYLDKIENTFSNDKEKQIAYKQLGIIAFSCTEALWKSLVLIVNNNCRSRNCQQQCKYYQYRTYKKLNVVGPKQILDHLTNMRLLYVHPFEEIAIEKLQNLRNHIHLMKAFVDGDQSLKFNKQFVEDMLRLYYVTINQAESNHWYYDESNPCLKELDGDDYDHTKNQQEFNRKEYYTNKTILALINIFYGKPLLEKDEPFLHNLNKPQNIDMNILADEMGKWLYFEGAHFRTEVDYQNALNNFYRNIKIYLHTNNDLIEKIDKRIMHYQNIFNIKK